MKAAVSWFLVALFGLVSVQAALGGPGMKPEQIYDPKKKLQWKELVGTWEILPDDNPLAEQRGKRKSRLPRMLMTLRKDGTCRVFNRDYPDGSDGLWTFDNQKMFITFPDASRLEFFVYGVKGDFMITRSPVKDGLDQLWSRVK